MAGEEFRLTLAEATRGIGTIPSLPAAVVELMSAIDRDDVDTERIARKIAQDQGLAARILRVANSPFYGQSNRVATIADAVIVLGLRTVRTLATAAAVTGTFRLAPESGLDMRVFWRHSVGTALCARGLARRLGLNVDEAFTGGLLHDVGRIALACCFPRHTAAVAAYQAQFDCLTIDAERALLGIDHAAVGQLLAERWRFPPSLCQAIGQHHAPPEDGVRGLPGGLHLADTLAHALDFDGAPAAMVPRLIPSVWNAAALSWADSRDLFAGVEEQFEALCEVLVS